MKSEILTPVAHIDILDGGVVLTFDDGEGAFLSGEVLHQAVSDAKLLPEFSNAKLEPLDP